VLNEVSITFEGGHNLLRSSDDKNYQTVERFRSALSRFSQKHQCYNVFGLGDADEPMEAVEGYEQASVFRKFGIDGHSRVAWVGLTPNKLAKRGLPGRFSHGRWGESLAAWRGSRCVNRPANPEREYR
jgi:hypothetical protein